MDVRPLTRRSKKGKLYQRPPLILAQIESALALAPSALLERARIKDRAAPDYLKEECLVYLIREYLRRNETAVVRKISEVLYRRSVPWVKNQLRALNRDVIEDAIQDVVSDVFQLILDLERDKGDFLQVRYWAVLKWKTIDVFRRHIQTLERAKSIVPLGALADGERLTDELDSRTSSVSWDDLTDPPASLSTEERLILKEGLNAIEEPYRTAFVLYYYEEWQIASKDDTKPTISRYFGKTERTIRNWLTRAREQLERWRVEEL